MFSGPVFHPICFVYGWICEFRWPHCRLSCEHVKSKHLSLLSLCSSIFTMHAMASSAPIRTHGSTQQHMVVQMAVEGSAPCMWGRFDTPSPNSWLEKRVEKTVNMMNGHGLYGFVKGYRPKSIYLYTAAKKNGQYEPDLIFEHIPYILE